MVSPVEMKLYGVDFLKRRTEVEDKLKLDPITYKHSQNVAKYCVNFIKSLKYNIAEDLVYYSGLFHDVGKTEVNLEILNKSGTLSREEFDHVRDHTSFGYKILLKSGFPVEMLMGAQLHHERYDGKGYPFGLKENEIPLIAKIISICDVFDALTCDRPYRKAYPFEEALQIMGNSCGQFDPELLSEFLKCVYTDMKYI